MMKENFNILVSDRSKYCDFLNVLQDKYAGINIFTSVENFESAHEHILIPSVYANNGLFVLFIEYPYLDYIYKFLNKQHLTKTNYIIVCFYYSNISNLSRYENVFDFINTKQVSFDIDFFINRLNNEIHCRNRISFLQWELNEFYEIGKSLSYEKDTGKLLDMIISSSMNLTSSDAGTIYLIVDKETGECSPIRDNLYEDKLLKFMIAKNFSIDIHFQGTTCPVTTESIFGYSAISGKTVRIDDAYNIPPELSYRHNNSFDLNTGYLTKSILTIPMKDHGNNVIGVIQLINKKKHKNCILDYSKIEALENIIPYNYNDELIMNSLAGQAAVALENNILYRDMKNLLQEYQDQNIHLSILSRKILKAHEEERRRIAREIHDGPAQMAASLFLKLEICKKYLHNGDTEKFNMEINALGKGLQSTVKEIRTIIYNLKPTCLEDGLIQALENQLLVFYENTGIKVIFEVQGDESKIEYYLASTIYRIVQEALSNINKHADANNVNIDLNITGKNLSLLISDDGKGFNTDKIKKHNRLEGGFGLEGIRERLELVRGEFEILSEPGKGTRIVISVPI